MPHGKKGSKSSKSKDKKKDDSAIVVSIAPAKVKKSSGRKSKKK